MRHLNVTFVNILMKLIDMTKAYEEGLSVADKARARARRGAALAFTRSFECGGQPAGRPDPSSARGSAVLQIMVVNAPSIFALGFEMVKPVLPALTVSPRALAPRALA